MFYIQPTAEGKSFTATTGLVSISSLSETPFLLFTNPVDSGTAAMLVNLVIGSTSVDNLKTTFRVYESPTISDNGAAVVSTNMRIGSTTASLCLVYKQPTLSSSGTLKFIRAVNLGNSSNGIGQVIVVEEGKSVLITVQNTAITGVSLHTDLNWIEGSF